ncbi:MULTISPECIES: citrate lyase holo-[acyl-carrier protein] synthase [Enterobacter]|uniref:citrate lyase holo-[acyl-carrier protein] synthase n=1 Tax=Enterobacter TaxID=547 RepID=UPI0028E65C19|nr:citrate lyase holo-[acyl-carrier protein] synthase [Enterobacter cloacae]HDR2751754.1 citrate lyase holo-[acyl-carrier protein] synthase [Enterobacter asburiae]WNT34498.1 citrate lyase holo-[acyl-carrier protein] synthase [Enterobacter cloacae]HDR2793631.1 citrate lyase holo-[acyl-carrier protein] synthase [Enterobacter asburiae]HDR2798938.1 citrate lyase holo-[acyl-carrier protein] synthase [Enterobacter asburiae]HDR2861291.1 citrate lyase holo-[acyl-carrier protein] synthase [Enterobacter
MTNKASNAKVSLEQILASREQRANRQQAWLFQSEQTVVSVTLVWPGERKDNELARQVMAVANETLGALFRAHHWTVSRHQSLQPVTGPEALWSVAAPAWMIKHVTAHLEDTHALGRLWDIDVLCPKTGLLKRDAIQQPMRRCFICSEPAHACSRAQRHSQVELSHVIEELTRDYFACQAS